MLIYFAKGVTIKDKLAYLALDKLPNKTTVLIFISLFALYHLIDSWLAQYSSDSIPEIILELISTTNFIFIACFTTVVTVPIIEEVIFRGFLFKAVQTSKYGAIGAILITSLLFTLMHAYQYDPLDLIGLFISALILGYARFMSNSLYLPILLHMLQNLIATIFLVDYIKNIPV